jgi:hypothetical protein
MHLLENIFSPWFLFLAAILLAGSAIVNIKKYLDRNISPAWKLSSLGVRNDGRRNKSLTNTVYNLRFVIRNKKGNEKNADQKRT